MQGRTVYEGAFATTSAPQSQSAGSETDVVVPAFEDHLAPVAEGESVDTPATEGDAVDTPNAQPTVEP